MAADRNFLAKLLSGQGGKPLTFEELMMQEKGNRDKAALRFNAQDGGPVSTAMMGAPPPDLMQTGGIPTPTPSPGPGTPPPVPNNAPVPIPTPRPQEILEDRATRDRSVMPYMYNEGIEQGQVSPTGGIHPTPLPGPLPQGGVGPGSLPQGGVGPGPAPQVPVPAGTASPTPLPTPVNRGNIVNYGDARRGALGTVTASKPNHGRNKLRKYKKTS